MRYRLQNNIPIITTICNTVLFNLIQVFCDLCLRQKRDWIQSEYVEVTKLDVSLNSLLIRSRHFWVSS